MSGLDLNVHTNLRLSPEMPITGWTSNLGDLPFVTFTRLHKNYVERPINNVLMGTNGDETEHESSGAESQEESMLSFCGLGKGYRFLRMAMFRPLSTMLSHRHQGCVWSGPKCCHQW